MKWAVLWPEHTWYNTDLPFPQEKEQIMTTNGWTWAKLDDDQMQLLAEAERSLGAEYILVYKPTGRSSSRAVEANVRKLSAAQLNESQMECLRGLEEQLHAVAVAYAPES
jgi:hypothetical protein